MAYTTKESVSLYMGVAPSSLPEDIDRLIERAGELLDYATLGRLSEGETAEKATNQQIEFWLTGSGESSDVQGELKGYSIMSVSLDFGEGETPTVAPRAFRTLLLNGFISRTIRRR